MKLRSKALLLAVGVVLACVASGAIGAALSGHLGRSTDTISYSDFVSIMLTGASLLLALVAFMVAILAAIGWTSLSSKVEADVRGYLDQGFKRGNTLHSMVQAELRAEKNRVMYEGVGLVDNEFDADARAEAEGEANA